MTINTLDDFLKVAGAFAAGNLVYHLLQFAFLRGVRRWREQSR